MSDDREKSQFEALPEKLPWEARSLDGDSGPEHDGSWQHASASTRKRTTLRGDAELGATIEGVTILWPK
jgi:hypothetical protein